MSTENLPWRSAVLKVLADAGGPLHYTEVEQRIMEQGLRPQIANSQATTNSTLRDLMSASGGNGVREVYNQKGVYALASVASALNRKLREEEAATQNSGIIKIEAFGLFWRRDLVNWASGQRLLGQQSKDSIVVDFADQDGVYILHDGREVMYVGKTYTPTSNYGLYRRLQDHNDDPRKTVYWDCFTWFGFKPVAEDGRLQEPSQNATLESVIGVIEAIFIETLLPRLNQQSGEGMQQAREDGLYFQVSSI